MSKKCIICTFKEDYDELINLYHTQLGDLIEKIGGDCGDLIFFSPSERLDVVLSDSITIGDFGQLIVDMHRFNVFVSKACEHAGILSDITKSANKNDEVGLVFLFTENDSMSIYTNVINLAIEATISKLTCDSMSKFDFIWITNLTPNGNFNVKKFKN